MEIYLFKARIDRIVDGDTIDIDIDLGFDVWLHKERVRLIGIDAPETRTKDLEEKAKGIAVKEYIEELLPPGSMCTYISSEYRRGKYGRSLGDFLLFEDTTLTEHLLEKELVKKYQG